MDITIVPCLSDNYAYLVRRAGSKDCVVIDPSEAAPVLAALSTEGLALRAVLNTHHHFDHVGGNTDLLGELGAMPVYGHASDKGRIPEQSEFLEHGDSFDVAGMTFSVLHVPGHTTGAITYVFEGAAFTGDTLFAGGCGRLFEGTPEMMNRSLNDVLAHLPDATKIYCGHEYTESNLKFALHIEPDNVLATEKLSTVSKLRAAGEVTVPSTMRDEKQTNPFLRMSSPTILAQLGATLGDTPTAAEVFGAVRSAKDNF